MEMFLFFIKHLLRYLWIVFPVKQIKKYVSSSSDNTNQEDQDDQDEEKMIRNELMNISNKLKEN